MNMIINIELNDPEAKTKITLVGINLKRIDLPQIGGVDAEKTFGEALCKIPDDDKPITLSVEVRNIKFV